MLLAGARRILALLLVCGLCACAGIGLPPVPERGPVGYTEVGLASWYGRAHHRKRTANGERFNMNGMTAAHRRLEFGTVARVTNLENGKTVKVRINDRGPYVRGRIIDLSARAADALDIKGDGVARVRLEVLAADQDRF
jgi:rare lipoprotein A